MRKRLINVFTGIIIGVLLTGVAFAASNINISAVMARDINIKYNGELQEFTDANGAVVYPVMVNGSTYLPVRAVAELVDLPVSWNGETRTVFLGTTKGEVSNEISLFDVNHTKNLEKNFIIRDEELLVAKGSAGNQTFKNGMNYSMWNSDYSFTREDDVITFDVKGYKELTFTTYSTFGDVKIEVEGDKDGTLNTFEVKEGSIVTKKINISGNDKLRIYANGSTGAECRIFEPVLNKQFTQKSISSL